MITPETMASFVRASFSFTPKSGSQPRTTLPVPNSNSSSTVPVVSSSPRQPSTYTFGSFTVQPNQTPAVASSSAQAPGGGTMYRSATPPSQGPDQIQDQIYSQGKRISHCTFRVSFCTSAPHLCLANPLAVSFSPRTRLSIGAKPERYGGFVLARPLCPCPSMPPRADTFLQSRFPVAATSNASAIGAVPPAAMAFSRASARRSMAQSTLSAARQSRSPQSSIAKVTPRLARNTATSCSLGLSVLPGPYPYHTDLPIRAPGVFSL